MKSLYNIIEEKINNNELIKIHLGCGSKYKSGWVNIDNYPASENDTHRGHDIKVDAWVDMKKINIKNGVVDLYFSSHVFEHFYPYDTVNILKNLGNTLSEGGAICIEMPDLTRINILNFFSFLMFGEKRNKKKENLVGSYDEWARILYKNTTRINRQYYGAVWESNPFGYQYHKFVWRRCDFIKVIKSLGFTVYYQSSAVSSHVPIRDQIIIFGKSGIPSKFVEEFIEVEFESKKYKRILSSLKNMLIGKF